jgi:methanogenic corrinoid protein MtbC1
VTQELTQAIVDLREDDALAMVDDLLASGADAVGILADCKAAMDVIGERFAWGRLFAYTRAREVALPKRIVVIG